MANWLDRLDAELYFIDNFDTKLEAWSMTD